MGEHERDERRPTGEVRSVDALDLERYLGRWHEIGRLPLRFEDEDASDITAEYSLEPDGSVRVDNRCVDEDGEPVQALGQAVPDDGNPARLRVSFLPEALRWIPFTRADYWVLRLDADYRVALVGTPDRAHLWLLSREPHLDPRTEREYLESAREQGYDLAAWIRPRQTGGHVTDAALARAPRADDDRDAE